MRQTSSLRQSPNSAIRNGGTTVPHISKKKQISSLWESLNFIDFYVVYENPSSKNNKTSYRFLRGDQGVFCLKSKVSDKLLFVGYATRCLYRTIKRLMFTYKAIANEVQLAWVVTSREDALSTRDKVLESYLGKPLTTAFEDLDYDLTRKNATLDLSKLHFHPPFLFSEMKKRFRTFRSLREKNGVYFIRDNKGVITYIGKGVGCLASRAYHHIHKISPNAHNWKRVSYFDKESLDEYSLAMVEVKSTFYDKGGKLRKRTSNEIERICSLFEERTTLQFDPIDNKPEEERKRIKREEKLESKKLISKIEKENKKFFEQMSKGKPMEVPF